MALYGLTFSHRIAFTCVSRNDRLYSVKLKNNIENIQTIGQHFSTFNPYPATTLVLKCHLLLTAAAFIQVNIRLDFFRQANNVNPDQTAP